LIQEQKMATERSIWEVYAAAWQAEDADTKRSALARSVTADAVYRDPLVECPGHEALMAYMLEFHQQIPAGHFRTTYFRAHHGRCIAKWDMLDEQERKIGDGVSYGEFSKDGLLQSMTGFFDPPPAS
jgi:SnoaL-like domain